MDNNKTWDYAIGIVQVDGIKILKNKLGIKDEERRKSIFLYERSIVVWQF